MWYIFDGMNPNCNCFVPDCNGYIHTYVRTYLRRLWPFTKLLYVSCDNWSVGSVHVYVQAQPHQRNCHCNLAQLRCHVTLWVRLCGKELVHICVHSSVCWQAVGGGGGGGMEHPHPQTCTHEHVHTHSPNVLYMYVRTFLSRTPISDTSILD